MMILRSSPPSPFGRKVKIAAALLGLKDQIEIVFADTNDPADSIRAQNPLGKIPALILEDGRIFFDSRVILEYLDYRAGGNRLVPAEPDARFQVLTQAAQADGLVDAALLLVYENRFREPQRQEPAWITYQAEKIARTLACFEAAPPAGQYRDISHIALACALGYLDLRFDGKWRANHPALVTWLDAFAADVPAFEATRFVQT
jgi:glutathione S-transferase